MILNVVIVIVFCINVANAGICRDFHKCKEMLPCPINDSCADIKNKMSNVMNCLDQTGACEDLSGAGVINGMCMANMAHYNSVRNCSFSGPDEACGLTNHPNFKVEYTNQQNSTNCDKQYPSTCDEDKFARYATCMKLISANSFTRGRLKGVCLKFRAGSSVCKFNVATTCNIVTFGSGVNGGNSRYRLPALIFTIVTGTVIYLLF